MQMIALKVSNNTNCGALFEQMDDFSLVSFLNLGWKTNGFVKFEYHNLCGLNQRCFKPIYVISKKIMFS